MINHIYALEWSICYVLVLYQGPDIHLSFRFLLMLLSDQPELQSPLFSKISAFADNH